MSEPRELAEARAELRRMGYLTHRLDRFLLQDALRSQASPGTVLRTAAKVGLLAGSGLAGAGTLALGVANDLLRASPADLLPLFVHLLIPLVAAAGLLYLLLAAGVALVLYLYPVRRIEVLALAVALAVTATGLALLVWRLWERWTELPRWQVALVAVVGPVAAWVVVRLLADALLAGAIRMTRTLPRQRLPGGRGLLAGLAAMALLLVVPALFPRRGQATAGPSSLPRAPGERVLLVGIDGVLADELDYLVARGELPAVADLVARGAMISAYQREDAPPAAFWTSLATGVPEERHGVVALDSFRPLGLTTPLARSGPLRGWWSAVAQPLGLAEYRPMLSSRRRAFTIWELAARGGEPVVAVNWWATFPAESLPGLVVAHGAYQLLEEGSEGAVDAVAPRERSAELRALRSQIEAGPSGEAVRAALPQAAAAAILDHALLPDRFYRAAFARGLASAPRAAALYLPGLDIAADQWRGSDVAMADVVRRQLVETDQLLAESGARFASVAVVFDPGRRGGSEGRILLWRAAGCTAQGRSWVAPAAVAAGLVRALGLPQSAELLEPPAICPWPEPPARITTFGERHPVAAASVQGEEYLESLRALGYL